jgi:hypothetical protein
VIGSHVVITLLDQVVTGMRVRLDRDPNPEPSSEVTQTPIEDGSAEGDEGSEP